MPAPQASAATAVAPAPDRNRVELTGRLSAPPDVKDLDSGGQLVILRVVVRRPDSGRVDSLPVVVGPPPAPGRRRVTDQASRRAVALASRLREDDRVEVTGTLQRHFWATDAGRRSRLQVRANGLRRRARQVE